MPGEDALTKENKKLRRLLESTRNSVTELTAVVTAWRVRDEYMKSALLQQQGDLKSVQSDALDIKIQLAALKTAELNRKQSEGAKRDLLYVMLGAFITAVIGFLTV